MNLIIDQIRCVRCGQCQSVCIDYNISLDPNVHETNKGCMECGHCVAICPTGAIKLKNYPDNYDTKIKYESDECPVETRDYLTLLNKQRSTRWFKKQEISTQEYEKLFKSVENAPTAVNMQDLEFVVIKDDLDNFMKHINNIIKTLQDEYPRIKEYQKFIKNKDSGHKNPLLWDGKELILTFAKDQADALLVATRIELMAQTMNLGGFYSGYLMMADKTDHEKLMEYFPDINPQKHLYCVYVIGHPKRKFKRQLPPRKYKVTFN